jgi:hypothetical protein
MCRVQVADTSVSGDLHACAVRCIESMPVRRAATAILPPSNPTTAMTIRSASIAWAMGVALVFAPLSIAAAQRTSKAVAGAEKRPIAATAPAAARGCLDTAATITPARLDERHLIYVEQETVVPNRGGRILVAGAPVYVWRSAGEQYELLGLDSLFGMIVEPSSSFVRAIPSPLPGRVLKGMRAAALPDGWWLVTFAEVFSVQEPRKPNVIAMWAGETDGSSWRAVEKLPAVADTLNPLRFSSLAMHDGRVRLAAVVTRDWQRRVVLFSRDEGRWTVRAHDMGLSEHAAITSTPTLDMLAVVRPDTTLRVDTNSLFFYTKAPTDTLWTPHPRFWRGGGDPVREPLFAGEATRPLLLWATGPMFRASSAWALSLATIPESTAAPIPLPAYVSDLEASSLGDAGVIATYDRGGPTRDIRVFEYHEPLRVNLVFTKPSEYRGLFGAALTPDRLVLIASKAGPPIRGPGVISMLETYAWRCPIADARSP